MATKPAKIVDQSLPRYRLTEKAYIDDKYLDPETMPIDPESEDGDRKPMLITYAGIPGWHMEPWNDAAREMVAKHPETRMHTDPILAMTAVGPGSDPAAQMAAAVMAMTRLAEAMAPRAAA